MYHKTSIISSEPPNWLEWPLVLPNVQVWTRHGDTFQFGDHLPIHNQTELVTDIAINKSMLNPKFHWIIAMMFDSCPLRQQQYRIRRLHRFVPLCISTGLWPSVHNYYALAALQRYGKRQGPVCLVIDNQVWWVMLILWVQEVSTDKSRQWWSAFTGGISFEQEAYFSKLWLSPWKLWLSSWKLRLRLSKLLLSLLSRISKLLSLSSIKSYFSTTRWIWRYLAISSAASGGGPYAIRLASR